MTFTTINDLTTYLFDADPGFRDELTEDEMRDIAQAHRVNRYEEITEREIETMIAAAYAACGVEDTQPYELMTTSQTATALGISERQTRHLARLHDVGWNTGRDWVFRPEDVIALRAIRAARPPGRPAKS